MNIYYSGMEKLTEKQLKVLRYIEDRLERNDAPSQREIALHFGLAQNAIYQLISYLRKKGYLADYAGHRRIALSQAYLGQRSPRGIPVVGRVAAGAPILAEENIDGYIDLKQFVRPAADAFILKVRGDSMIDAGILDGDLVVVEPASQIGNGQIAVGFVNGEVTVKRIYIQQDRVVFEPANKSGAYKSMNVEKNNETVRIIGKVTGCIRKL
ncbi:MAG: repressor LexA [Sedimentisphaerales bacterium]|nr:repressor LexA [Sedimentisphaerales bacterium]